MCGKREGESPDAKEEVAAKTPVEKTLRLRGRRTRSTCGCGTLPLELAEPSGAKRGGTGCAARCL